jgi:hypothetical protein
MHDLEPYHQWRDQYIAANDPKSPFYGRVYNEFSYTTKIYNYYIHPQWDSFESTTLFAKILFADYDQSYAMIEFIGEWNDALHEDMMVLKRKILEPMMDAGISRFIFFCDNLLNFHANDDDYYQELYEDLEDMYPRGWVVYVNTHLHVEEEMQSAKLDRYVHIGEQYVELPWRGHKPHHCFEMIEQIYENRTKLVD